MINSSKSSLKSEKLGQEKNMGSALDIGQCYKSELGTGVDFVTDVTKKRSGETVTKRNGCFADEKIAAFST